MAEDNSKCNSPLAEVAADFLLDLAPQDKGKAQIEVYKFIRWLGLNRKVNELSPVDIASYAEQITPSATKPVKSFLTYIRKKGFTKVNLATHLRAKKTSKVVASWQNSQEQATLTTQGYAKLEAELANLKSQRSNVIEELQKAAADKDFRENAPLEASREQKAHLEGRIQEIESTLRLARIVDAKQSTLKIKMGDTVMLCDLSSGEEIRYTLVDPRETNPAKGKLSIASPVGKALLDKEKGQAIEVTAPAGIFNYRIKDILSLNGKNELS